MTILQLDDLTGKDIVTNPGKSRGQIGGSDNRPWHAEINAKQNAYNKIEGMKKDAKDKRSALAKVSAQSFSYILLYLCFWNILLTSLTFFVDYC